MAVDPMLAPAISTAHATWFTGVMTSVAAVATFLAVVGAFVLQQMQRRADDELRANTKRDVARTALDGCERAVAQITVVAYQISEATEKTVTVEQWEKLLEFASNLVDHFLAKDIGELECIICLLNARSLILDARKELAQASKMADSDGDWVAMVMLPDGFEAFDDVARVHTRRIATVRANLQ